MPPKRGSIDLAPSSLQERANVLKPLVIKGKTLEIPVIQGGMGVGVSLHPLASAVAEAGGAGIVSSACIDRLVSKRLGKRVKTYEAIRDEIALSKARGGFAGINIMVALVRDFENSVRGAIDAGADFIISGAGLPMSLPAIQSPKDTALIPIVSSHRALSLICRRWARAKYRPDAVVLEGPLAGGHLGFKCEDVDRPDQQLEELLPQVKEVAQANGDFPVIVAGGIYSHEDIARFQSLGADGVQMGTRFLATEESSATAAYKAAVLSATEHDIMLATDPGSPCGLPIRVLRCSPQLRDLKVRLPNCDKGYLLRKDKKGKFTVCPARDSNEHHLCICNGLLSSAGYNPEDEKPLYTVGTNAARITEIPKVADLMRELAGQLLPH